MERPEIKAVADVKSQEPEPTSSNTTTPISSKLEANSEKKSVTDQRKVEDAAPVLRDSPKDDPNKDRNSESKRYSENQIEILTSNLEMIKIGSNPQKEQKHKCSLIAKGGPQIQLIARTNNNPGDNTNGNCPCGQDVREKIRLKILGTSSTENSPASTTFGSLYNGACANPPESMEVPFAGVTQSNDWELPDDFIDIEPMIIKTAFDIRKELCDCLRYSQSSEFYEKLKIYHTYNTFDEIINGYEYDFQSPLLLATLMRNHNAYEHLLSCIQVNVLLPHRDWNTVYHIIAEQNQMDFLAFMLHHLEKFKSRKCKTIAMLQQMMNKNGETVWNIVCRKMSDSSMNSLAQQPFMSEIQNYLGVYFNGFR